MKTRSYNNELKLATAQFLDVFNDMVVVRKTSKGQTQKSITVPCRYGSRSRILKSSENRGATLKLPLMATVITGMERDVSRVHSSNEFLQYALDSASLDVRDMVAVPINVSYELSMLCAFQEDLDQIICSFTAMMNPDLFVVWPSPRGNGNIKSQIVWNGSVNIVYPEEISETEPWRILGTTSFVYKTWIFPGVGAQTSSGARIRVINRSGGIGQGVSGSWFDTGTLSANQYLEQLLTHGAAIEDYDQIAVSGFYDSDGEKDVVLLLE